jgi:hypothetical protein
MDYGITQMKYLFKQKKESNYGDGNDPCGASKTLQFQGT